MQQPCLTFTFGFYASFCIENLRAVEHFYFFLWSYCYII